MVKEVKEDLKSEMRELEEVVLAVERATIQGERIVVWLQRIRSDWVPPSFPRTKP